MKFCTDGKLPNVTVKLNGNTLKWVCEAKHLGNWITNTLDNSKDCHEKKCHFIGSVNKLMNKFARSPYPVKRKLFLTYCLSFYGSQAWVLSEKCVTDVHITWNKAVRRVFGLPYSTHTELLPRILKDKGFIHSLHLRSARYIHAGLLSKNPLVQYFFCKARCDLLGTIGCNIKHLMYKYDLDKQSFLDKGLERDIISNSNKVSSSILQRGNMVIELLSNSVQGFTSTEVQDIIEYLCTS